MALATELFDEKSTATLEAEREKHLGQARTILETADKEGRGITVDEQKQVDAALEVARGCKRALDSRRSYLEEQNRKAKPLDDLGAPGAAKANEFAGIKEFTKLAAAVIAGGSDRRRAIDFATERFGECGATKALMASVANAGGVLIPTPISNELIELLRPQTCVLALGARPINLEYGTLPIARQTGAATARFTAESSDVLASEQTLDDITLVAKEISALVPISNQLIRYTDVSVMEMVQQDLVNQVAVRTDQAYIRDDGTSGTPKGLRYQCATGNVLAVAGTTSLADVSAQLSRLELRLLEANVPMFKAGWMFAPRTAVFLKELRDGNGNKAFPEMDQMRLRGFAFKATTSIPVNLSTNQSEVYLADFNDVLVGIGAASELAVSSEAAYLDAGGVMRSAFAKNQTVVRITAGVDVALRHAEACAVLTGVTWGA